MGGVPARRLGDFDALVEKYKNFKNKDRMSTDDIWNVFFKIRKESGY